MLTPEEIMLARYPIHTGTDMEAKNKKCLVEEKNGKKTDLTWDQTAAQAIKHNLTDLGKISKTILEWISAHENPRRKRK